MIILTILSYNSHEEGIIESEDGMFMRIRGDWWWWKGWLIEPIELLSYDTVLELHLVARERAGLVTEDVLDHAQLLVDGGGVGLSEPITLGYIHLYILLYEVNLEYLHEFH